MAQLFAVLMFVTDAVQPACVPVPVLPLWSSRLFRMRVFPEGNGSKPHADTGRSGIIS